jgi:prolyl-tRNA synthetase
MGSYGIGVSRAVAAVAEQTLDDAGLCWPREIAPADVHVIGVGKPLADGQDPRAVAHGVAQELARAGLRVLLDDRGLAPGVAFTDADLIGIPTIVTIGKALADGEAEVKDRRTGQRSRVALAELAASLA